jgi:xeroderma pigmentosum group C-complementing protein
MVPKNERGHVDVWGAAHIPPGCVHLPYPRLKAVCKKLVIDYADAMVGFDVKGGRSVPRFEGVVVCEEFESQVMKLYHELEQAATDRAEKRRMKAITTNWKRLVRGSIVHARIMRKVMNGAESSELAFVPGATVAALGGPLVAPSASSAPLAATAYGALATSLHAAAAAASAPLHPTHDAAHVHAYSQRSFDVATNAWTSMCACGSRQTFEEM